MMGGDEPRLLLLLPSALGVRLGRLATGLVLFGVSVALLIEARLGLDAWDALHQGVAERTGLSFGSVVIAVSVGVVLLWVPLHQRPGLGTITNVIVVGLAVDAALAVLPEAHLPVTRVMFLATGILLNAAATALYIGAGLGPGPRDGLMTGLARRGHRIGRVRTGIEMSVLTVGWLLGGTVGIGTVLYALSIGPLIELLLPKLAVALPEGGADR
jgi:uncharacterized membrane protein YczE